MYYVVMVFTIHHGMEYIQVETIGSNGDTVILKSEPNSTNFTIVTGVTMFKVAHFISKTSLNVR